jgi:hypothetical protein
MVVRVVSLLVIRPSVCQGNLTARPLIVQKPTLKRVIAVSAARPVVTFSRIQNPIEGDREQATKHELVDMQKCWQHMMILGLIAA